MKFKILLTAAWLYGCGGDDSAGGVASEAGSASATGGSTEGGSTTTHGASSTTSSESSAETGEVLTSEGPIDGSDDSSSSSSSTGTSTGVPRCDDALSERECEGIELESTPDFQSPSCRWIDIYNVELSPACSLSDTTQRCVLFFGNSLGCGGPGCAFPNDGELYVREFDGGAEVLVYPQNELCGPTPAVSEEDYQWEGCANSESVVCDCFCGLL